MVNNIVDSVLEGIFPQYCYLCRLRSHNKLPLCGECRRQLSPNSHACWRCALPLAQPQPMAQPESLENPCQVVLCGSCQVAPPPFDHVIAPWLYDEQLAFLLHRWKYRGDQRLTGLLAQLLLSGIGSTMDPPDILIPVPLHWRKFWRRGWNQSELLALELRKQSPVLAKTKLATRAVQRHRATAPQAALSAAQRRANMLGAFTVRRRCDNLRVAILDDVVTTGATAAAMANALLDAGASGVELWCIARTPEPQE